MTQMCSRSSTSRSYSKCGSSSSSSSSGRSSRSSRWSVRVSPYSVTIRMHSHSIHSTTRLEYFDTPHTAAAAAAASEYSDTLHTSSSSRRYSRSRRTLTLKRSVYLDGARAHTYIHTHTHTPSDALIHQTIHHLTKKWSLPEAILDDTF